MISSADLLERYGIPALARLWGRAREVLERRDLALGGSLTLARPSAPERAALEQLLGRAIAGNGVLRVRLVDLDEALRDTRFGAGLVEVLEAVGGADLVPRRAEAAATRRMRADRFAGARAHPIAKEAAGSEWLTLLERGALARAARGRDDDVLAQCLEIIERLPVEPPILRTLLASRVGGSPHLLDDGSPVSTLVLRFIALREGHTKPRSSVERRELWAAAGVLADTVSATVLVLGLRLQGGDPASRMAAAGADLGEPVRLTLRSLRALPDPLIEAQVVFVCENPSIVEVAADRLGATAPPLICVEGEPTSAATRLLLALRRAGADLRYHGDFDAKGVEIGAALMRLGARPWRYGMVDYLAAVARGIGTEEIATERIAATWDTGLREAMSAVGLVVYEEQVVDDLVADLAAASAPTKSLQTSARPALVSPSRTRAYLLGDPLLDWLAAHGRSHGFVPDDERPGYDSRTDLLPRILEHGQRFEDGIVQLLDAEVGVVRIAVDRGSAGRTERASQATHEAMVAGAPIIAQATLVDEHLGIAGVADLLVRSDVLERLIPGTLGPEAARISAPAFGRAWHYRVVEVKYRTFELTVDGSAGIGRSTLPYLGQVWLYNRALGQVQGWLPPSSFLLGRGTTLRGERLDALARLARVDDDRDVPTRGQTLAEAVLDSLAWCRRVDADGAGWQVLPEPSVPELWPHLRNTSDAPWRNAKHEIGLALSDLTALPRMNPTRRAIARAQGLQSWRDPRLAPAIVGLRGTGAALFEAVRLANIAREPVVIPERIEHVDQSWRVRWPLEFFVDFETVSDVEDDLDELPNRGGEPIIFQIGCGHRDRAGHWRFGQWTTDRLSFVEERRILDAWFAYMRDVAQAEGASENDIRTFHWSPAEPAWLGEADIEQDPVLAACRRHPDADWPAVRWFDLLLGLARAEPIGVTGAFGFGLKAIAKAMHAAGRIQTTWDDGPTDGLGAMVGAWWCNEEAARTGQPMGQIDLMREIATYNEIDVRAMSEVLEWLRANR